MSQIFVSYRRADSRSEARGIYERMARTFGASKVFMDVEDIEHGAEFPQILKQKLLEAKVLVAVIGPQWLASSGPSSQSRLFELHDFVRVELLTALERQLPVIPVLVNGAQMPAPSLLPQELQPLLSRNAAIVTHENFATDIAKVNKQVAKWVRPLWQIRAAVTLVFFTFGTTIAGYYLYHALGPTNHNLVSIEDFSAGPADSDLDWLKIKVERNLVDLFADNSVPVTHRSLSVPTNGTPSVRIVGSVERIPNGEISIQVRFLGPGRTIKSAAHEAPFELWKETYKSIPEAMLFAMNVNPISLKANETSKRPTSSFRAALMYFEAVRLAKAPRLESALVLLDRATAEDPSFALAYWAKAQILRAMSRPSEAEEMEGKASALDPDHSRPILVGVPSNPLPSIFQRMQRTDWSRVGEDLLYKKVEQESYGITLQAWSFAPRLYQLGVVMASNPLGTTVEDLREQTKSILVVNGGFFDIDRDSRLTPSGLVISQGRTVSGVSDPRRGGSGVIFDRGGSVGIEFAKSFVAADVLSAVQVGPIVVDPGGKNGIRRNDFDRQDRSAICLVESGRFVVVVVKGGLSLFELGEILAAADPNGGFACERAINLDGGPSTQVSFLNGDTKVEVAGRWKISNGVIIGRR